MLSGLIMVRRGDMIVDIVDIVDIIGALRV
jgi:hypothetical protein